MNNLISTLFLSVFIYLASMIPVNAGGGGLGTVVHDTEIPYAKMIKNLNAAVKAEKMLLVTRASASRGAAARDISIKGNMIVGVFRNDFALRMLEASIPAGIEAPIRFYITERRDGSARLSYKTPSTVFEPYLATAEPELDEIAKELDVIFAKIAQRAISEN